LLSESDKLAFLDCLAYWASAYYGFVINLPRMSLTNHPFFSKWSQGPSWNWDFDNHALRPFGHYETDVLGNYCCKSGGKNFSDHVDFGSRLAQLRYCVARPEFKGVHPLSQFGFERAMGFGLGNWDYIVEENVDGVFSLFAKIVQFSFDPPDRIRAATK
jgi:hypothetical protein